MSESVNLSILNRDVHTLYNESISVFYCIMYCYIVFQLHMTKPAVSRMHYNCYTYQKDIVTLCL